MVGSGSTMGKLRPQAAKLMHIAQTVFAAKSFSKSLGTDAADLILADPDHGVVFAMNIPERICVPNPRSSHGSTVLPVSSALAIFDELSSYSFLVKDKRCRLGVSVVLSVEMLKEIPSGSRVKIVSKASKIGKSLGYSDMHMHNSRGELVARGYHTKYLPMGPAWDFLFHPSVINSTLSFYDNVLSKYHDSAAGKALAKLILDGHNREVNTPSFDYAGSVFDAFRIEPVALIDASEKVEKEGSGYGQEIVESSKFAFEVLPFMCNIRGFLHGGCTAMSIEKAITASNATNMNHRGWINRMDVQYLNGMKVWGVAV